MGGRLSEAIKVFYFIHEYRPEIESVAKEIRILKKSFSGPLFEVDRLTHRGNKITRRLNRIVPYVLEKTCHLSHIYYPRLIDLSRILYLRKPLIFSVVARYLGYPSQEEMKKAIPIVKKMDHVITADSKDEEILHQWGLKNVSTVLPGIDIDAFKYHVPTSNKFIILMASAPWVPQQLEKKGIRILLEALKELDDIEVIFLWRGFCLQEMKELIKFHRVERSLRINNQTVNVPIQLGKIHATIAPFTTYEESRAYPTSIIESLAAGKPVIVTDRIPISMIIEREGCGTVVSPTKEGILNGIEELRLKYPKYQKNCIPTAKKYFSQKRLLNDYLTIYQEVLNRK